MRNKKNLLIFVFICITIFSFFYYIFFKIGNNNSKEKIVDGILNSFNVYEADVEVTVYSNKTKNKYDLYQIVNHNQSECVINEPKEISGLSYSIENERLLIRYKELNMEKEYSPYNQVINNSLFLNTFSNDCETNGFSIKETEKEIIIKTILKDNKKNYI